MVSLSHRQPRPRHLLLIPQPHTLSRYSNIGPRVVALSRYSNIGPRVVALVDNRGQQKPEWVGIIILYPLLVQPRLTTSTTPGQLI